MRMGAVCASYVCMYLYVMSTYILFTLCNIGNNNIPLNKNKFVYKLTQSHKYYLLRVIKCIKLSKITV